MSYFYLEECPPGVPTGTNTKGTSLQGHFCASLIHGLCRRLEPGRSTARGRPRRRGLGRRCGSGPRESTNPRARPAEARRADARPAEARAASATSRLYRGGSKGGFSTAGLAIYMFSSCNRKILGSVCFDQDLPMFTAMTKHLISNPPFPNPPIGSSRL